MREKIYHCLSLLNIILFTIVLPFFLHSVIDLHFEIESPIYLSVFIASILWLVILYFAVKNIKNQKNELANLDFNITIFLLTPIVFLFQQWLSSLILLNYLLLTVFLPYEKLTNRQLNILIVCLIIIWMMTYFFPFISELYSGIFLYLYIWVFLLLFVFLLMNRYQYYWIVIFHIFLSLMLIRTYQNFFFIEPFRASPTDFNFLPIAIGMLYLGLLIPFVFSTFSLVYFNNKNRKNSLKMKTWTE